MHPSTTFNINFCHYEDVTHEWLLGLRCGDIILHDVNIYEVCRYVMPPLLSQPVISYGKDGTTPTQESRVLVHMSVCMVMLVYVSSFCIYYNNEYSY